MSTASAERPLKRKRSHSDESDGHEGTSLSRRCSDDRFTGHQLSIPRERAPGSDPGDTRYAEGSSSDSVANTSSTRATTPDLPDNVVRVTDAQTHGVPYDVTPEVASESGYAESDRESSTDSLTPSCYEYVVENHRKYHSYRSDVCYWGPNDEKQQYAEYISHALHLELFDGRLSLAPTNAPQRVVDLGCGTGDWAIAFAEEHPSAQVIGVDLSPIQPDWVPGNCRFVVDDINQPWDHSDYDELDLVHIRGLSGSVFNWVKLYKTIRDHLTDRGILEHVEHSWHFMSQEGTIAANPAMAEWEPLFNEVGRRTGRPFTASEEARQSMIDAGFSPIVQRTFKVPVGHWPKEENSKRCGELMLAYLQEGVEGMALRSLTRELGWTFEKVQIYLAQLRKELKDISKHCYVELRVVCWQKPAAG